jgi:excisionase family DNA binding protein
MSRFSTKQVAEQLGVSRETVVGLIRSGQLEAINVSLSPSSRRPRYRITEQALRLFEEQRAVRQAPKRRERRESYTRFV